MPHAQTIYSPRPEIVGGFSLDAAEAQLAKVLGNVEPVDKKRVELSARSLKLHFQVQYRSLFDQFDPFMYWAEPTGPLQIFRFLEKWHYDQGEDGSPTPILFGATVKPPDVLTGHLHVPDNVPIDNPEVLAAFALSEDGQAAIQADIESGNLEPVTTLSPGDIALFNLYALHKRCDFLPEDAGGARLTARAFERD